MTGSATGPKPASSRGDGGRPTEADAAGAGEAAPPSEELWRVEGPSFVGRAGALAELGGYLDDGARLITIFGMAGLGKTRLLRRFGAKVRHEGLRVWFCDLRAATTVDEILYVVGRALGVPLAVSAATEEATAQLGHALAARGRALLLLDNFEQIAVHAEVTVGRWLRLAPEASFLVASRETLRLEEEVCFELPPLEAGEAALLFEHRARRVRPDLAPNEHDRLKIAEIVRRLDNLPLAIELAAARAAILSPSEIESRLSRRFELLRSTRRDIPPRHATLEGAIACSWQSLMPWEQAALAECSVFRGGFGLSAADAVVDLTEFPEAPPVVDVLQALQEKSLLRCHVGPSSPNGARFSLYESIREFAAQKLSASAPGARAAEARHARFYVEEVERWARLSPGAAWRRVASAVNEDLANCHSVVQLEAEPELAVRTALALDSVLTVRGPSATRLALLEQLGAAVDRAASPALRGRYLRARSDARRARGKLAEAREDLELARELAQESGDRTSFGPLLLAFGHLALEGNRLGEAELHYREALAAAELTTDGATTAIARCHLHSLQECRVEELLRLVERVPDFREHALLLYNLGNRATLSGELPSALELFRHARLTARETADPVIEARAGFALGAADLSRGYVSEAAARYEETLPIHREVGDRRFEGLTLVFLGVVRRQEGNDGHARPLLEDGLAITAEVGERWGEGFALANLAALEASKDRLGRAETRLACARRIAVELGDSSLTAVADVLEGILDLARARRSAAAGSFAEAERLAASARARLSTLSELGQGASGLGVLLAGPLLARAVAEADRLGEDADPAPPWSERPSVQRPAFELEVGPDGRWLRVRGGERVDMHRRHAMRRLLVLLVEQRIAAPGRVLSAATLIAAGWPGERILPSAAANRLHNAIAVLRGLGLRSLLHTVGDGYALAAVSVSAASSGSADEEPRAAR